MENILNIQEDKKVIAFIIPFKPKRNSNNWEQDSFYLSRTLKSLLNQKSSEYHVYVICHDLPLKIISSMRIDYVRLPFEYIEFDKIEDRYEQMERNSYLSKRDVEYLFDQGRKQMFGADLAKQNGYQYIMSVDADDIICKTLTCYITKHNSNKVGWYVNKGYYFFEEKRVYARQPNGMNMINGSTYIIHYSLIPQINLDALNVNSNNFFSNHLYLKTRIREFYGKELKALPFYAILYVVTNISWWASNKILKDKSFKTRIKFLVRRVYYKKSIRKNFIIPSINRQSK